MGTLKSHTNWSHEMTYNGCELGDPVELDGDPATWEWDDSLLPNGWIDAEGNVTVDDPSDPF